jgi:hypothetical protein
MFQTTRQLDKYRTVERIVTEVVIAVSDVDRFSNEGTESFCNSTHMREALREVCVWSLYIYLTDNNGMTDWVRHIESLVTVGEKGQKTATSSSPINAIQ